MATAQDIALTEDQFEQLDQALKSLDPIIHGRGAAYMRERAVRAIEWTKPGLELQARVQGTKLYTTQLRFIDEELQTDCTCPYGEWCKHSAALMLELRKNAVKRRQVITSRTAPSAPAPDPASIAGKVTAKLGQPLPKATLAFLNHIERWWQRQERLIDRMRLNELCGKPHLWSHGEVELYPVGQPPKDEWEFLHYVAIMIHKQQLELPAPLYAVMDPMMQKRLMSAMERTAEIHHWRQNFSRWQESSLNEVSILPELRLQLFPTAVVVQARYPNETSFTKATQKLLKELSTTPAQGGPKGQLSAGSSLVLRAACNEYGSIRSGEVTAMSEMLSKSLTQLASSADLFRTHVCNPQGEPIVIMKEALVWDLSPAQDATTDYTLRLLTPQGTIPAPPLAILRGQPLRYVTSDAVYPLSYWPFGKEAVRWPLHIPGPAIESREGVSALGKLGVKVPQRLEGRVTVIKAEIFVRCQVNTLETSATPLLRINARSIMGPSREMSDWNGHVWQPSYSRAVNKKVEDDLIQLDQSRMNEAADWLRQLPLKLANLFDGRLWVEQRILGKNWPDQFLSWLERRPKDIQIELDPELASLKDGRVSGNIRLEVEPTKSSMDWFDLGIALEVTDTTLSQDEIKLLLNAQGKWLRLKDKGWRKLDYSLSEAQLKELADLGLAEPAFDGQRQRLHALQLTRLGQGTSLLPAERAAKLRQRVEEIQTRISPALPAAITATLRPYQLQGFHFLAYLTVNHFGGVLADDMGLGKTLQTLAWIAWLRAEQKVSEPILVVCPKSVQDNWRAEAERFFPSLRVEVWNRLTAGKTGLNGEADMLVIHYPHLRSHEEPLAAITWGAVILDEAQAIKNPSAQSTRAACALKAHHRLALTGTPIENRLLDLWSIFNFAMPGVLGHRAAFSRDYDGKEDPLARRRLAARTRPFLLRRTKNEVAADLPERVEEDLIIELDGTQSTLYQAELKRARAQLLKAEANQQLDKLRFNILTSLLRLRQICCHPRLLGLEQASIDSSKQSKKEKPTGQHAESAKVSALLELLEQLTEEGQKVLVFSQFVEMLEIIEAEIKARSWSCFKLTGETEDRGPLVKAFQDHDGPATFLISLKAGGFGLNLTAASYVVLFDPWWNPAVEAQAIDRTHRIGQKQTVFAYRLLIKNSIEEKIRLLQKQKASLANDLLGEENFAQALTLSDFHFLLAQE